MGFDPISSDYGPCDLPSPNHENDSEFVSAVRSSKKSTTARMSHVRVMRDAAGIQRDPKGNESNKETPMPKLTKAPKKFFNYWWVKLMTAGSGEYFSLHFCY